jgi:hypothetical protein
MFAPPASAQVGGTARAVVAPNDARAGRTGRRPIALTKALAPGPSENVFRNIRI